MKQDQQPKKQQSREESVGKFVPSTGDEDYMQMPEPAGSKQPLAERKDWTASLGAHSIGELNSIADVINDTVDKTNQAVARGQIKVGKELLRARAMFKGDKEFGQWRKEKTQIQSKTAATQLMRVAEKFSSAPKLIDACSFSVLRELVYAPQEAVKQVEAKVDAGEKVSKRDAINIRQGTTKRALAEKMGKEPDPVSAEEMAMNIIINPIEERIRQSNNPWDILGLYRFAIVHPEIVEAIEEFYTKDDTPDEIARKVIEAAHKVRRELQQQGKAAI